MAAEILSKSSKWFKLPLHRSRRSKSTSPASPLSPNQSNTTKTNELREVFRYFDGDGDGLISALELRSYFGSIGEYMSNEEATGVIKDLDSDGDNLLDFDDFLRLMNRENGDNEDLKIAFEMFQMEKGSGCITPRGLQKMLNRLGDSKSYEQCVDMIRVYDIDGNGVLDFHEFHQMMA